MRTGQFVTIRVTNGAWLMGHPGLEVELGDDDPSLATAMLSEGWCRAELGDPADPSNVRVVHA